MTICPTYERLLALTKGHPKMQAISRGCFRTVAKEYRPSGKTYLKRHLK
jgi:hypothetical protein